MTPGYKYRIKRDTGFKFLLYPNNSNHQPIGESESYSTRKECIDALNQFRGILIMDNASSFFVVHKEQTQKYYPQIVLNGKL